MDKKILSIIIPAYNEERTITKLLDKLIEADLSPYDKEIILINDASKDNTLAVVNEYLGKLTPDKSSFIKVLSNEQNLKKSQTVKKGILLSRGDLVVTQDADLEYEPSNLKSFIQLFETDPTIDIIYGNRFVNNNKVIYWQNYLGNKLLTLISNLFTFRNGFVVKDMEVCYKMGKGNIIRKIATQIVSENNFGIEPEITARLSRYIDKKTGKHLKLKVLSIDYYPRTIAEGKHMKAFRDGFSALKEIFRFNLQS